MHFFSKTALQYTDSENNKLPNVQCQTKKSTVMNTFSRNYISV